MATKQKKEVELQTGPDIICPECRQTSTVPSGGVKQLPDNNRIVGEVALKQKDVGESIRSDLCVKDPQSENTQTEADVPEWALLGKEVTIKILQNERSKEGGQFAVEARSSNGDIIPSAMQDNDDGSYSASFVANQTGEVKVSISIKGKHIKGSPYTVVVRQHSALNIPSKVVDVGKPSGIAFGKDVWAVADWSNHCVCIFDKQDQLVRKFGSKGNSGGQLNEPYGLAFDANNHLYVVNYGNHRVQNFSISGEHLLQFGDCGSGNGQLKNPVGITVSNDRVFVADQGNHRISVFQCGGQFSHNIGQSGHLNYPFDVAVNDIDQVLVANWGGNCISIFTIDGNYVNKVGIAEPGRGHLSYPTSLTVDIYGFILVTEGRLGNNRVSIFNKDGVFICCFGSNGSANGQFSGPCGIALSPNGTVYVSDCDNKRIQIFSSY